MLKVMVNSPNDSSYLRKKQQWGLKLRNNEIWLFSTRTYFWRVTRNIPIRSNKRCVKNGHVGLVLRFTCLPGILISLMYCCLYKNIFCDKHPHIIDRSIHYLILHHIKLFDRHILLLNGSFLETYFKKKDIEHGSFRYSLS